MERIRMSKRLISVLIVLIVFGSISYVYAYSEKERTAALKYYELGYDAYNKHQLSKAERYFNASYDAIPHSQTAYMLSVIYVDLNNTYSARNFAQQALRGRPPLENDYKRDAKGIIAWSKVERVEETTSVTAKTDDPYESSYPRQPQLAIPGKTLPIAKTKKTTYVKIVNLTGKWKCDDGGIYFLRQVGNDVWWYGQSRKGKGNWANVFHGQMKKNMISGKWADVPQGHARSSGKISLRVGKNGNLIAIRKTGGFGGKTWSKY